MNNQTLRLIIKSRQGVIFDGPVTAITSLNPKGTFDVLPMHGNFISIIDQYLRIHEPVGGTRDIAIHNGVLHVRNNVARVYLGFIKTEPVVPAS